MTNVPLGTVADLPSMLKVTISVVVVWTAIVW
jgi:hypothetical protein